MTGIDSDLIELEDGMINGTVGKSKDGRLFQQFYGILMQNTGRGVTIQGLFHKAIMQSGTAFSFWSHYGEGFAEASATAMLILSGCYRTNATIILKCLQRIPVEEFQDLETKLRVGSGC
ncbi:Carboxylesterase 5A [Sarracenia purpurea var. burkii]